MVIIKSKHYNKQDRYVEAITVLDIIGLNYTKHNKGVHIVIEHKDGEIHYWPTTGKWRVPGTSISWKYATAFIQGLLDYLGEEYNEL